MYFFVSFNAFEWAQISQLMTYSKSIFNIESNSNYLVVEVVNDVHIKISDFIRYHRVTVISDHILIHSLRENAEKKKELYALKNVFIKCIFFQT